ncbi:MAG: hypothetical protein ABI747_02475 [Candidatus Moraniibacteriota bacterium]
MPKKTVETEVAQAVEQRIKAGEGSPYACLMHELQARGFNTQDPAVTRRWVDEILRRRKIEAVKPPEQKELQFPLR